MPYTKSRAINTTDGSAYGIIRNTAVWRKAIVVAATPPSKTREDSSVINRSLDYPQRNRSDHAVEKFHKPTLLVVQVAICRFRPAYSEGVGKVMRRPLPLEGCFASLPERTRGMEVPYRGQFTGELSLGNQIGLQQLDSVVEDAVLHFLSSLCNSLYLSLVGSQRLP